MSRLAQLEAELDRAVARERRIRARTVRADSAFFISGWLRASFRADDAVAAAYDALVRCHAESRAAGVAL